MIAQGVVAAELARFNGVELNPCVWEAVYDYPVDEAAVRQLAAQIPVMGGGYDAWLKPRFQAPGSNELLPTYHEVLGPPHAELRCRFPVDATIVLPSPAYEEIPPVETSCELHERYPVVKISPYYLLTDEPYRVLQSHIGDPDLFTLKAFDV